MKMKIYTIQIIKSIFNFFKTSLILTANLQKRQQSVKKKAQQSIKYEKNILRLDPDVI